MAFLEPPCHRPSAVATTGYEHYIAWPVFHSIIALARIPTKASARDPIRLDSTRLDSIPLGDLGTRQFCSSALFCHVTLRCLPACLFHESSAVCHRVLHVQVAQKSAHGLNLPWPSTGFVSRLQGYSGCAACCSPTSSPSLLPPHSHRTPTVLPPDISSPNPG